MQSAPDHDLLIRVATLLDRFEKDLKDIKDSIEDFPDIRARVDDIEEDMRTRIGRNNALIIALATVVSAVVTIIVKLLLH
jgi:hypothetical protein